MKVELSEHMAVTASLPERLKMRALEILPVVLVLAIYGADLLDSADVVVSILYVVPILLTISLSRAQATYLVFVLSSVATVAAAAFGVRPSDPTASAMNHALALVAQVLAAAVVIQQLQLRDRHLASAAEQESRLAQARASAAQVRGRLLALGSLIKAIPEGVLMLDSSGVVIEANEAALRLLSLQGREVQGRPWREVARSLAQTELAGAAQDGSPLLDGRWPFTGPSTLKVEVQAMPAHVSEPIHCVVSGAALRDTDGVSGGVVVVHNITELRAQEREKDEFVSIAAHELRSPIATLRGYAQLAALSATRPDAPDLAQAAAKILRQADRLNRMVSDLLDISRIQTGRLELVQADLDMPALVRNVAEQQRASHPTREIFFQIDGDPPVVRADDQRIQQVLVNLLDNALKYSPDGGDVRIRLWHEADGVCATVTDKGVGIPQHEQQMLFQRFYRGRTNAHRFSGLGVGLYISHRIIIDHGGRMWVESVAGQGSTFGFALPVASSSTGIAHPEA